MLIKLHELIFRNNSVFHTSRPIMIKTKYFMIIKNPNSLKISKENPLVAGKQSHIHKKCKFLCPFKFIKIMVEQAPRVGGIGVGTFMFFFLLALIVVIFAVGYWHKLGKIVFWVMLLLFFVIFIILWQCPVQGRVDLSPLVNQKYYVYVLFGFFSIIGVIVSLVFYILIVLLHSDKARIIPT